MNEEKMAMKSTQVKKKKYESKKAQRIPSDIM